jgi:methionyl aminopeptidase
VHWSPSGQWDQGVRGSSHRLPGSGAQGLARFGVGAVGDDVFQGEADCTGGTDAYTIGSNGWAIRSADGSRAAHAEHTVAITDTGPRILTTPAAAEPNRCRRRGRNGEVCESE